MTERNAIMDISANALSPAQRGAVALGEANPDRRIYPSAISIATAHALERKGYGQIVSRGMSPVRTITGKPSGYTAVWYFQLGDPA
jgi:hypothetical protein